MATDYAPAQFSAGLMIPNPAFSIPGTSGYASGWTLQASSGTITASPIGDGPQPGQARAQRLTHSTSGGYSSLESSLTPGGLGVAQDNTAFRVVCLWRSSTSVNLSMRIVEYDINVAATGTVTAVTLATGRASNGNAEIGGGTGDWELTTGLTGFTPGAGGTPWFYAVRMYAVGAGGVSPWTIDYAFAGLGIYNAGTSAWYTMSTQADHGSYGAIQSASRIRKTQRGQVVHLATDRAQTPHNLALLYSNADYNDKKAMDKLFRLNRATGFEGEAATAENPSGGHYPVLVLPGVFPYGPWAMYGDFAGPECGLRAWGGGWSPSGSEALYSGTIPIMERLYR